MSPAAHYEVIYGQNERVLDWVRGQYQWGHLESTIGLERNGELVAAAGYTDYIAGGSISGHIVGQRMTRAFIHAILWYPFAQLQVRRLSAFIPKGNTAVKRFIEHIGFTYEATLERMLPADDILAYRFFREDWHG